MNHNTPSMQLDDSTARRLGSLGGLPWLPGRSEDPWFSITVFRRVWLCRCYLLRIVEDWSECLTVNLILRSHSINEKNDYVTGRKRPGTDAEIRPNLIRQRVVFALANNIEVDRTLH